MSKYAECTYIGIDPGKSGGIAWVTIGRMLMPRAVKMPETERDLWSLFCDLKKLPNPKAVIEEVHAMPASFKRKDKNGEEKEVRQGIASTFAFGRNYGFLRGLLIASEIPFEEARPVKWQKLLGCLSKGDKTITKSKAQQLFPMMKITHATADALLISEYCKRVNALTPA